MLDFYGGVKCQYVLMGHNRMIVFGCRRIAVFISERGIHTPVWLVSVLLETRQYAQNNAPGTATMIASKYGRKNLSSPPVNGRSISNAIIVKS
jgi:hypothetical protein